MTDFIMPFVVVLAMIVVWFIWNHYQIKQSQRRLEKLLGFTEIQARILKRVRLQYGENYTLQNLHDATWEVLDMYADEPYGSKHIQSRKMRDLVTQLKLRY